MEFCPLFDEQSKLFKVHYTCEATDEDLKQEPELIDQYCQDDFKKCLRYQTYQDLKIEYMVRRKLKEEFGASSF
jgi:hypothetical protein